MTICISVKIPEGLVLAADSMVTLQGEIEVAGKKQSAVIQTFEYANKVTQVKDYPIGAMSWGLGSIQDRSMQSLVMEFEYSYLGVEKNPGYTVKKVAEELVQFVEQRYDLAYPPGQTGQRPSIGLLIGGYSSKEFFAEQYEYEFSKKGALSIVRPNEPGGKPSFGANWFGLTDALVRLIKGFDNVALAELVKRGADKAIVQQWVDDHISELPLVFDGMPLQDAIDFAEYAAQVVIGRWRFGVGAPLCGGDIDIAVIRPSSFTWAKRKAWAIR